MSEANALTGFVILQPGETLVVTEGTVDVFIRTDNAALIPFAVVAAGTAICGANQPVQLIATCRQGAQLAPAEPRQIAGEDFAQAIAITVGIDPAALLKRFKASPSVAGASATSAIPATDSDSARGTGPEHHSGSDLAPSPAKDMAAALTAIATETIERERLRRQATASASLNASRALAQDSLKRAVWSATALRDIETALDPTPLAAAMTRLGVLQGFTIVMPTPQDLATTDNPLRLIAHRSGIRLRRVRLRDDWRNSGVIPMLGFLESSDSTAAEAVVLVRKGRSYHIQAARDLAPVPLTEELAARLLPEAIELFAPLPMTQPASRRDLIRYALIGSRARWLLALLMGLGVAAFGLITPILTQAIVGTLVPSGQTSLLITAGIALALCAVGTFVFLLVQSFAVAGISQVATRNLQAALWSRLLALPAPFFRRFSSGDLAIRTLSVDNLASLLSIQVVTSVIAALFAVVYLIQMMMYDFWLGLAGAFVIVITALILLLGIRALSRLTANALESTRAANSWLVQLLNGIAKVRVAHAEDRMAALYLEQVRKGIVAEARQTQVNGRIAAWMSFAVSAAPALYFLVVLRSWTGSQPSITSATYIAFFSAASLAFIAMAGLSAAVPALATVRPTYSLLKPILDELPESSKGTLDPGALSGRITFDDVEFRYGTNGPLVLRGLSFEAHPGSMVALVGPSGAGKSTVTRLILGFEEPLNGRILLDGKDLSTLDLGLVRQQMGVVVQNGRITRSSVLRNIAGPTSNDEAAAWAAAEKAAIADDIRAMPMGMHTIVDPNTISGGQAQRLLIARALLQHPSIMLLDEATSALDNGAQAAVSAALQEIDCTRIVIAHRLSTIKSADRILVLDAGRVVESGSYEELMELDGLFSGLVRRQLK